MKRLHIFSILILVISVSCGASYTETTNTYNKPTSTKTPSLPSLPAGYEIVNDDFINIAFALPEGWTNKTLNESGSLQSVYITLTPNAFPRFRIATLLLPINITSPEYILSSTKQSLELQGNYNVDSINEYEATLAGQQAAVMEYYYQYTTPDLPIKVFCIMAVFISPDHTGYIIQWTGTSENVAEIRDLFEKMTPFFQFIPTNTLTILPTTQIRQSTETQSQDCALWSSVTLNDVGRTMCVRGEVKYINFDQDALYIAFGNEAGDFYILAYGANRTNIKVGDCVKITREIQQLGANPVSVWDQLDDLYIGDCQ